MGGVARALLAVAVLSGVVGLGPTSATVAAVPDPPTALELVPVDVGSGARSISCPTDDLCVVLAMRLTAEGWPQPVVYRVVEGVPEEPVPVAAPPGDALIPGALDCADASFCMAGFQHYVAPDLGTPQLAVSTIVDGVPGPPETVTVEGSDFLALSDLSCRAQGCAVVGQDQSRGFVATIEPGVPPVVDRLPVGFVPSDVDCPASGGCQVAGGAEQLGSFVGFVATRVPGGVGDVQITEWFLQHLECASTSSCVYVGTRDQREVVGRITADGPQQPVPVTDGLEIYGLACNAEVTSCYGVGEEVSGDAGVILPIVRGVPGEVVEVASVALVSGISCGSNTCTATAGSQGGPWDSDGHHLVTGLSLPAVGPLDVDPPSIDVTTPTEGQLLAAGEDIVADYTCADPSLIAVCTAVVEPGGITVTDGATLPNAQQGTFTFTVTAVDGAGNKSTATRTYEVGDPDALGVVEVRHVDDGRQVGNLQCSAEACWTVIEQRTSGVLVGLSVAPVVEGEAGAGTPLDIPAGVDLATSAWTSGCGPERCLVTVAGPSGGAAWLFGDGTVSAPVSLPTGVQPVGSGCGSTRCIVFDWDPAGALLLEVRDDGTTELGRFPLDSTGGELPTAVSCDALDECQLGVTSGVFTDVGTEFAGHIVHLPATGGIGGRQTIPEEYIQRLECRGASCLVFGRDLVDGGIFSFASLWLVTDGVAEPIPLPATPGNADLSHMACPATLDGCVVSGWVRESDLTPLEPVIGRVEASTLEVQTVAHLTQTQGLACTQTTCTLVGREDRPGPPDLGVVVLHAERRGPTVYRDAIPPVINGSGGSFSLHGAGTGFGGGFACTDDGYSGLVSCITTLDGERYSGGFIPLSPGLHHVETVAVDGDGNVSRFEQRRLVAGDEVGTVRDLPEGSRPASFDCVDAHRCFMISSEISLSPASVGAMTFYELTDGVVTAQLDIADGAGSLASLIQCWSATSCTIVANEYRADGFGDPVRIDVVDGTAGDPEPLPIDPATAAPAAYRDCRPDACRFFAYVGGQPQLVTLRPDAPTTVHPLVGELDELQLGGLSCPGPDHCLLTAYTGSRGVVIPIDEGVLGAPLDLPDLRGRGDVECAGVGDCLVVGEGIIRLRPGLAPEVLVDTGPGFSALHCGEDLRSCIALTGTVAVGLDDGEPIVAHSVSVPTGAWVQGIDCATSACTLIGYRVSPWFGTLPEDPFVLTGFGLPDLGPTDEVAPTAEIGAPPPGARLAVGADVEVAFTCADEPEGSGIASCTGMVEPGAVAVGDGDLLPTSGPGSYTLTVTARDAAGNTGTAAVTYEVVPGSASEELGGGGVVSTGDEASPDVPVQTELTAPASVEGEVTILPQPVDPETSPEGFVFFGEQVVISGPPSTPAEPYELTFLVDATALDGLAPADVEVFRNGERVLGCTHPTEAKPNPCVVSRGFTADGSGDAEIRVRTATFSEWSFALRLRPATLPDGYVVPQELSLLRPGPGVLENDSAVVTGDQLTARLVGGPEHGVLVLQPDGGFGYTPAPGYVGADVFTYEAVGPDGVASPPTTVLLTVTPRARTSLALEPVVIKRTGLLGLQLTLGTVAGRLTADGAPVVGRTVHYTAGGNAVCTAVTDEDGWGRCAASLTGALLSVVTGGVVGTFDGDDAFFATTGRGNLVN